MPENRNYYVIADDNTKAEAMTKQEILAALQTAIQGKTPKGQLKFPSAIKEINNNRNIKLWAGNEDQYEAATLDENTLALVAEHNNLSQVDTRIELAEGYIEAVQVSLEDDEWLLNDVKEDVDDNKSDLVPVKRSIAQSAEIVPVRKGEMQNIAAGLNEATASLTASSAIIAPYATKVAESNVLIDEFDGGLPILSNVVVNEFACENWTLYKKLVFVFSRNGVVDYKIFYFPLSLSTQQMYFYTWGYDEDIPTSLTGVPVRILLNRTNPNKMYFYTTTTSNLKLLGVIGFERR